MRDRLNSSVSSDGNGEGEAITLRKTSEKGHTLFCKLGFEVLTELISSEVSVGLGLGLGDSLIL